MYKFFFRDSLIDATRVGMENFTPFLPYGDALQKQRRILDEGIKKDMIASYHQIQAEKVHLFLDQLLRDPNGFKEYCKMSVIANV